MARAKKHIPLEESIAKILKAAGQKPITIQFLMKSLSGKGRFILLIFLSLTFCQPIPLPGLSTIFGLLIALFGVSIILDKQIWLPKKVFNHTISNKLLKMIAKKGLWIVTKLKKFTYPRLTLFVDLHAFRIFNGIIIALLGLFVSLPLPIPLTNLIPGWIILLMALGLLEDDGLLILLSYSILTITLLLLFYLIILPLLKLAS